MYYYLYLLYLCDYWQRFLLYYLILEAGYPDSWKPLVFYYWFLCWIDWSWHLWWHLALYMFNSLETHTMVWKQFYFSYPPLWLLFRHILKGSCDVAKNNIILCIWCNVFDVSAGLYIIFHILYIIVSVAPLSSAFLKSVDFYKVLRSEACSDWPAIWCVVIGWIPQACDGNVTPLTVLWCRVMARRHKNSKPHHKLEICCIQRGDNYWLLWLLLSF